MMDVVVFALMQIVVIVTVTIFFYFVIKKAISDVMNGGIESIRKLFRKGDKDGKVSDM